MVRGVGLFKTRGEHASHTRTHLTYSGLRGGLEHLKIEMRSIEEMFESEMGEFVN